MKKVLLTTPYGPYDVAWGEDMMDLMTARLARDQDVLPLSGKLPAWGLHLIAENLEAPTRVLESPRWEDFLQELSNGYDVIGIQLKTINNERCARMIEAIRARSPKSEIVIGGYGVGALNDPLPGDRWGYAAYIRESADHLCRDEGVRFMQRLLGERTDRPITQYELPYATFSVPGVRNVNVRMPAVLVSLGCPSACEFCNTSAFYWHKKHRIAEPEQTYAFLRRHLERLGGGSMHAILFDEDLFLDPEYVRELGRLIRSDRATWDVRWVTFGSVRALSQLTGEELRACGLGGVWIGVESGMTEGDHSKTGYAKREGSKSPVEIFEDLHRHGIETIGSTILGFDFHTPENLEQDIDYFVSLKPTFYQVSPLTPCPGTKLYRRMLKEKRILDHYDHTHFHLWKDDVFRLAHFEQGELKRFFDLAHEKLRTVNGPPVLQVCEANVSAYEALRGSSDAFLRHQAERSRELALGALPIVRTVARHAPSPQVLERAREIERRAAAVLGAPSLRQRALGAVVEAYTGWIAASRDGAARPEVRSEPTTSWTDYVAGRARARDARAMRAKTRLLRAPAPPPPSGPLSRPERAPAHRVAIACAAE